MSQWFQIPAVAFKATNQVREGWLNADSIIFVGRLTNGDWRIDIQGDTSLIVPACKESVAFIQQVGRALGLAPMCNYRYSKKGSAQ